MQKQDAFFRPLHEALANKTMDGFSVLSDDRLVQMTTFSDGSRLIANFDAVARKTEGHDLSPASLTALVTASHPASIRPDIHPRFILRPQSGDSRSFSASWNCRFQRL
ncbi:MAG: hypothetical protein WDN06_15355 [Asticcacaulis sp.]